MPDPFNPKFVDLVRNFTTTQGPGNFVLGAAVTGFTSLANAVTTGDRFYYCVTGIDKPAEREVGRGTMMADGTIAREPVAGASTNFSSGNKSIALIVAADWFQSAGATPSTLFSEIPTRSFPATVHRIDTHGRTAPGKYPATYIRDPDQTINTTIGQALINALPAGEQAAAATAVQALLARVRAADASGAYWVIDDDGQEVHAGHFGYVADATFLNWTGVITGTDNSAALQALVDWRLYLRAGTPSARRPIIIPPGMGRINKGIQLGYGNAAMKFSVRGSHISYEVYGGTVLACDFDNQPAFATSAALLPEIEDITFVSKGSRWYIAKGILDDSNTAMVTYGIDDRDIVNHHDPAYPQRAALLRFNPCAAVAIDPYKGTAPAAAGAWVISTAINAGDYRTANAKLYIASKGGTTASSGSGPSATTSYISDAAVRWDYVGPSSVAVAYPAADMPAWLPAANRITYGRAGGTTSPVIRRCQLYGFSVGVALQPCNSDGNGDFLSIEDCESQYTIVPLSVGNTQSRNVNLRRYNANRFHTYCTTNMHGVQNGKLGGLFANCSASTGHRLFDLGSSAYTGPLTLQNIYAEAIHRLGDVPFGASPSGAVIEVNGGHFFFIHSIANGQRGVPLNLLGSLDYPTGAGGQMEGWIFRRVHFQGFKGVAPIMVNRAIFEDCIFSEVDSELAPTAQWQARYFNTLAGGLVVPRHKVRGRPQITYQQRDETTLALGSIVNTDPSNRDTSRDTPASLYTPSFSPYQGFGDEEIKNPQMSMSTAKTNFGSVTLTGRVLTFTSAAARAQLDWQGLHPGGVLIDSDNGMIFVVQTRTGAGPYAFTCQLQNGYSYSNAGAISYVLPFSASAGDWWHAGGGLFTPRLPLFGNLDTTTALISSIQRSDGNSALIDGTGSSVVQVGDILYCDMYVDNTHGNYSIKVTTAAAASLTMEGGSTYDANKKRFPLWIRGVA